MLRLTFRPKNEALSFCRHGAASAVRTFVLERGNQMRRRRGFLVLVRFVAVGADWFAGWNGGVIANLFPSGELREIDDTNVE